MIATAPEYVECENLYPDEFLDFFGLPRNSVISLAAPRPLAFSFSDFHPKAHTFQWHRIEYSYLQPVALDLVLSVSLRC